MRSQYLDKTKYNKLYSVMQYDNVLALRVALETGMRIGDVLALRTSDLRARTITYTAQKTGKSDRKVIDKQLADELRRNSHNGYLFPGRSGKKSRTRQTVYTDLRKACDTLGVSEHITPHSTRKTMAVDYFHEHGLEATQAALQHDRSDTTMLYAFADLLDKGGSWRKEPPSEKAAPSWDSIDAFARQVARYVVDMLRECNLVVKK